MQLYTHMAVAAALGVGILPHEPALQALCVLGAVVPDTVMIPAFVRDVRAGRRPLMEQSSWLKFIKEVSHSTFLWFGLLGMALMLQNEILFAIALGGASHAVIDMFTHGDKEINQNDHHIFWPLLSPHSLGTWDYRYRDYGGLLRIKPLEQIVLVGSVLAAILLWSM
jgi:hypothetical protein